MEHDFSFLKDPVVINSVFLKKLQRNKALGLILLISLLLWRLIELNMRSHLKKQEDVIPGWDNKPTERPTIFIMTTKSDNIGIIKDTTPKSSQQFPFFNRDVLDYLSREAATVGVLGNLPGANAQLRSLPGDDHRFGHSEAYIHVGQTFQPAPHTTMDQRMIKAHNSIRPHYTTKQVPAVALGILDKGHSREDLFMAPLAA